MPRAEEICDGREIRVLPSPNIPLAPLAMPFSKNGGAQEKRNCWTTVAVRPAAFESSPDWMAMVSSTSSPRAPSRVMLFSGKISHFWAPDRQFLLPTTWAFAVKHLIERLGTGRLEEDAYLEAQSVQRNGPPRSTTSLMGTRGVP